jgi:molybdopterin synthase sulfur carrier subunit
VINILFFAQLREQLQCEKLTFDIPSPLSITDLRLTILQKNPHWAEYLNSDKLLFALNQTLVKPSQLINDGDEVAFFPPVTGG